MKQARYLRFDSSTVVLYILKALLHHIGQILRQNFGCLCRIDGCSGLTGLRNLRKLAAQCVVDDLFIQSGLEHGKISLEFFASLQ